MKMQFVAGAVALALFATHASAEPAFISIGDLCGVADSNLVFHASEESMTVVSNSGQGNLTFKCSLSGVFNDTGSAVHYDFENTGMPCTTLFGATYDWKQVLSEDGNAKLTCKINPNSDLP